MNLSISIPNHINTLEASNLTRDEVIEQLYEYWLAGVELSECTTDLPKNIVDLNKFNTAWVDAVELANISKNETTEQEIKEALEQCVSDEWDTLYDLINDNDEDFAEACIEYANGGSLDDAKDKYIGQYDSDEDFIREINADILHECSETVKQYFDWESFTADQMHYYTEINGYYFNE